MRPDERKQLTEELKACNTYGDLFKKLLDKYELDQMKLGMVSKPFIINTLIEQIDKLNPPLKNGKKH